MTESLHIQHLLPKYYDCLKHQDIKHYMPDLMLNIPFFHFLFEKPTKLMIDSLSKIRRRLSLPALPPQIGANAYQ